MSGEHDQPVTLAAAQRKRPPAIRRARVIAGPAWEGIGGGCHLNRPIRTLIEKAGFAITQLKTGYIPGPKPTTFLYEGRATPVGHG
jgi:hypothetical protein